MGLEIFIIFFVAILCSYVYWTYVCFRDLTLKVDFLEDHVRKFTDLVLMRNRDK